MDTLSKTRSLFQRYTPSIRSAGVVLASLVVSLPVGATTYCSGAYNVACELMATTVSFAGEKCYEPVAFSYTNPYTLFTCQTSRYSSTGTLYALEKGRVVYQATVTSEEMNVLRLELSGL